MKIILKIVILMILCSFFAKHVNAEQRVTARNFDVNIIVNEDLSLQSILNIEIRNDDPNNLIGGYRIELPFKNPSNIKTFLNNSEVTFSEENIDGFIAITLLFSNQAIRPNDTALLTIEFKNLNIISDNKNFREIFLPGFELSHSIETSSYSFSYPKTFQEIAVLADVNAEIFDVGSTFKIKKNNLDPIYIIWGEKAKFRLDADFTLTNEEDSKVKNIFNAPMLFEFQNIYFDKLEGVNSGVYDALNNQYFVVDLDKKSSKKVVFSAYLEKNYGNSSVYPNLYNYPFDSSTKIGEKINSNIDKSLSPVSQIAWVNDFIKSTFSPVYKEEINLSEYANLWHLDLEKDPNLANLSSLEYCFYIVSFAESINVKAKIEYGYILSRQIPNFNFNAPHVWCTLKVESKDYLVDPYLEELTGLSFFGEDSFYDRLIMGTWHPDNKYDDILGLLSKNGIQFSPVIALVDTLETNVSDSEKVSIEVNFPKSVYSGFRFSGDLEVINNSKKIIMIGDFYVDKTSYINNLKYNGDLYPMAVPLQTSTFRIKNINPVSYFYNRDKNLEISIVSKADSSVISTSETVNFEPHKRFWLILFFVSNFSLFVTIYLIFRIKRKSYIK